MNNGLALAARRADRRVMLLTNTSSIRFVAILALGPSGGQRKPVMNVNRPKGRSLAFAASASDLLNQETDLEYRGL